MAEAANSLSQGLGQVVQFVRELTARQKALMAIAAVAVAATLFGFVRLMAKPEMKPLMSGMEPQDAQALASQLAAKNMKYEISQDGRSVLIEADELDRARFETASQGVPRSGRLGFELFDKMNWAGSDFSEKVNYQRALEGELERTIQTLRGVQAVRVHLVMPEDSVFVDREQPAKASVVLRLRSGLDAQAQMAIANLVAGAVERLRPENVAVIDADTNRPLDDRNERDPSSQAMRSEDQLAAKLVQTLEPVAGRGRVRATVHMDRDITSGEETQETYDPATTVALAVQKSEERVGSSAPMGIPGTASNVPGAGSPGAAKAVVADDSQSSKSESSTYAVNKTVRHTLVPAGRVRRITAAVLVDDAIEKRTSNGQITETRRKRTPGELKQIEELARASLGLDTSRGDVLTVESLSFQVEPVEVPLAPSVPQRVQTIVQQWSGVLRIAALGAIFMAVYLMFLRPLKKQLVLSFHEMAQRTRLKAAAKSTTIEGGTPGAQNTLEVEAETPDSMRLKRQVLNKVKAEPVSTSRLLQTWIRDGAAK
ncbi:MAG: flagellar basal-body MS-ring/collar protein FliF [Terriglobia bacterium]|nr:flagellar basal-body MS-ring/collar protein FliF [Terriglobia bacterium]